MVLFNFTQPAIARGQIYNLATMLLFDVGPQYGRCSVPHRIASALRQLAMDCSRLSKECSDKDVARELVGLSTQLAEKAAKLERLYEIIEAT